MTQVLVRDDELVDLFLPRCGASVHSIVDAAVWTARAGRVPKDERQNFVNGVF